MIWWSSLVCTYMFKFECLKFSVTSIFVSFKRIYCSLCVRLKRHRMYNFQNDNLKNARVAQVVLYININRIFRFIFFFYLLPTPNCVQGFQISSKIKKKIKTVNLNFPKIFNLLLIVVLFKKNCANKFLMNRN